MAKEKQTEAEIYRAKRKARIAKASKKNQKQLISQRTGQIIGRVIAVLLVVAIVAGVLGFALSYNGILARSVPAIVMEDGTKVSRAEYRFYYLSALNQVESYASYYGDQIGMSYDDTLTPDKQEYTGSAFFGAVEGFEEGETPTWADFLSYYTKNSISQIKAQYVAAQEMGLTLSDEDIASINESITSAETTAKNNNYSLNAYLRRVYGNGINEKLYRQILTEQALANKVHEAKEDEIKATYDDAKVEDLYKEKIQTYGVISYLSYTVTADIADGETEPSKAAMKAARASANELAALTDEAAFLAKVQALGEAAAAAADAETADTGDEADTEPTDYTASAKHEDVAGSSVTDEKFADWAFGEEAAAGTTYIVKNDMGYTVYLLTVAPHKAADVTNSYSVRHILVSFPEDETEETADETADETAEEVVDDAEETADEAAPEEEAAAEDAEDAEPDVPSVSELDTSNAKDVKIINTANGTNPTDKATYEKALGILQLYLDGEHTEDAFAALSTQYNEDPGSQENGGLYADTELGQMVEPFESWAINPARKAGDVGIVETEYGYHIMYFVSVDVTTWSDAIIDAEADDAVHAYLEEVNASAAGTVAKERWIPSLDKSIIKKIKKDISNARNNSAR